MKINPQRSMRKAAALALTALGLAAVSPVNAKTPEPVPEIDYGPAPTWERYKEVAEKAVKRQLVDPYSAMFEWPWGFKQGEYKPFLGRRIHGYFTCGLVNARNRMGGYTGSSYFLVVVRNDVPIHVGMRGGSDVWLDEVCSKSWFPYVHELEMAEFEAKQPPKPLLPPPPPDHGMALIADPAGLWVERLIPGGRGEAAGVKPGMVITRINNISLVGVSETIAAQIVGNLSLEGTVKFEMTDGTLITLVRP